MVRSPKSSPPSKGRIQQALKNRLATAVTKVARTSSNPARRAWLVRHVERQNGRCAYCGIPIYRVPPRGMADCRASLDHVVPLSRKGADSEANTVAACEACNTEKSNMTAQAFRLSPFCIARKAYAATIPQRAAVTLTVTVRKRRRPAGQ